MSTEIELAKIKVGNEIRKARGDRSLRNYAELVGVDKARLSRIENGIDIPNNNIIEKITCEQAAPQNGITKEKLQELVGVYNVEKSVHELSHIAAGAIIGTEIAPLIGTIFGSAIGYALSKISQDSPEDDESDNSNEQLVDFKKNLKRFKKQSMGLIYESLINQNIRFHPDQKKKGSLAFSYLTIEDRPIEKWSFEFAIKDNYYAASLGLSERQTARWLFSRYVYKYHNRTEKMSIVTNNNVIYEELSKLENKTAFRGNFSVILIDDVDLKVLSESNISYYSEIGSRKEVVNVSSRTIALQSE